MAAKTKKVRTKQPKQAKVEIELPNGTRISARGPMAEQLAQRMLNPQVWYYPTYNSGWSSSLFAPAVYGVATNSTGTASPIDLTPKITCAVTNANGADGHVTINGATASLDDAAKAMDDAFNKAVTE